MCLLLFIQIIIFIKIKLFDEQIHNWHKHEASNSYFLLSNLVKWHTSIFLAKWVRSLNQVSKKPY